MGLCEYKEKNRRNNHTRRQRFTWFSLRPTSMDGVKKVSLRKYGDYKCDTKTLS